MDSRVTLLQAWLTEHCQLADFQLEPMAGDASFRRYFRVRVQDKTFVAMDAPPERENCLPFVAIADALRAMSLVTPQIIASNLSLGFLLLTDLGDTLLLNALTPDNAESLYARALTALAQLKDCRRVVGWQLPIVTVDFLRQELQLFQEWFLQRHLNLTLTGSDEKALHHCFDFLAHSALQQPQIFMHRDYHSANLMVMPHSTVGILDFQDALIGPVTYDLVSLLRDCYIAWPETVVNKLVHSYWERIALPDVAAEQFKHWFDLMGLQRHMKALLTFSRKLHRDGNANYLQHIPRTLNYLLQVSGRLAECRSLHAFLNNRVVTCVQ